MLGTLSEEVRGVKIHIDAHIPICRGLGSSAALLVAGAMGANVLRGNKLSTQGLLNITNAMEGHPDNLAPAFLGGLTASMVDGGLPVSVSFPLHAGWEFLVLIPDFTLSTPLARSVLPEQVNRRDAIYNISHGALVLKALELGDEKELRTAGVTVNAHPWLEGCFEVSATGDLERLPAFTEGHFTVQDAAARLVATAAAPQPETRALDMCAAPGGKSFALAIDMGDRGDILSCDIHPHKLALIEKGAARLGIRSIRTALADGREHHAAWENAADLVVADVPCSGLGIIRKKPDIRYKDPKELAELPAIQAAILDNAATYVRPGGVLLYSTCTVLPEENEGVTTAFLDTHPEFALEPFTLPRPIGGCCGQLTLWPQRYGTDGFYICRMRRK